VAIETEHTVTELLHAQHQMIRDLFEQVAGSIGNERRDAFDDLRSILAVHETGEEQVVHPVVRRLGGRAEEAVVARLEEEDQAKRMLAELEKVGPDGDGFAEMFEPFQDAVLQHAQAEEDTVFNFLDEAVDEDKLRNMATALLVAERMAPTHPHPHAPEGALGNMLTGPFIAMADRVRDALQSYRD
jgi:hemerythrin superfamily protein